PTSILKRCCSGISKTPDGGRQTITDCGSCSLVASLRPARRRQPLQQQRFESSFVLEGERDRQRVGVSGKLTSLVVAAKPREILFRSPQHEALALALNAQPLRLGARIAVRVRKASRRANRHAGVGKGCKKFLRVADAGKGERPAAAEPRDEARVWAQARLR